MSARLASALDPFGREAYEQALGIPSGSMLDALPYADWSEAQELNALAAQTNQADFAAAEMSAAPNDSVEVRQTSTLTSEQNYSQVTDSAGLCTPDNPFGLNDMELAAVRYYYWQDVPRLTTENFTGPMMMHLEETMPQERDAWLASLEGPQMRSLSNEEYQASIEATRAIERRKEQSAWRDTFHYDAAFSLLDAQMMAAADVAFAPIAARIGKGLSELYWGVRGEQAATNAALRAELRTALEADFKFYTGSVPSSSAGPSKFPLSQAKIDEIKAIPHGQRPDPSEYLSTNYIENHLSQFDDGASRFMTQRNLDKYGIGQRDGTSFVMPKKEADRLVAATNGNPRAMEEALGLPENFLEGNQLVRVDIPSPRELNLRLPSGNEAGANDLWIPGGRLPNGNLEAVIDVGDIPSSRYWWEPLQF